MRNPMPIAPAAFLLLFIACLPESGRPLSVGPGCDPTTPRTPSAYAVVANVARSDTLSTITICLASDTARLRIAGYHGELTMGRGLQVVGVDRPPGGTRIENTSAPGRVSFAGVASSGFAPGAVLVLRVAQHGSRADAQIRLTMLDVTDIAGRDVAAMVHVDSLPRLAGTP